jgi:rubrerythrin
MRKSLENYSWDESLFDPNNETGAYLQAMADGTIFTVEKDPFSDLTGDETVTRILKAAITREKDSVVYYEGMKYLVPDDLGKEKIDQIIREEMNHVVMLSQKLIDLQEK